MTSEYRKKEPESSDYKEYEIGHWVGQALDEQSYCYSEMKAYPHQPCFLMEGLLEIEGFLRKIWDLVPDPLCMESQGNIVIYNPRTKEQRAANFNEINEALDLLEKRRTTIENGHGGGCVACCRHCEQEMLDRMRGINNEKCL